MNSVNRAFKFLITALLFWLLINLFIAAHSPLIPSITKLLAHVPMELLMFVTLGISAIHYINEDTFQTLISAINLKNRKSMKQSLPILKNLPKKDKVLMVALITYIVALLLTTGALLSVFFSLRNTFFMWVFYVLSLAVISLVIKKIIASWADHYLNFPETMRSK
ncbi:hypothetical protein SMN_1709 [Sulfurospirillum multivorans]|nr:hypothetical protein SMN_1709 [Sulfurospirillum multivorans]